MNNRAEMLRQKMDQRRREQQLFTVRNKKKKENYGANYPAENNDLKWWEKCLFGLFVIFALVLCWLLKPN